MSPRRLQRPRAFLIFAALAACSALAITTAQSPPDRWWTGYGNGPDNARYFPSTQITRNNVTSLQVAWTYPFGDAGSSPIVVRGVIYGRGRNGSLVTLGPVRPKETDGAFRLGFVLQGKGLAAPEAVVESVRTTGIVSKEIVTSLGNLVHKQGREEISSPVGIVQGSSTAASQGVDSYLWVLGLISLSLALLNLLPLLPLDGGHIFFSLLEAVRGRAVAREVYERVSAIGIALVLMLFFIGLSNDVGRLGQ